MRNLKYLIVPAFLALGIYVGFWLAIAVGLSLIPVHYDQTETIYLNEMQFSTGEVIYPTIDLQPALNTAPVGGLQPSTSTFNPQASN